MTEVRAVIHRVVTLNTGHAEWPIGASCMRRYISSGRVGGLQYSGWCMTLITLTVGNNSFIISTDMTVGTIHNRVVRR